MTALTLAMREAALEQVAAAQPQMLKQMVALAEINSGSFHAAGVNRVRDRLMELFADLGATMEVLPSAPLELLDDDGELRERALGDGLRIVKRPDAPLQVFLCGHMDTVFAQDHPFQQLRQLDADTLNGPGVADLKGGLVVMHQALLALESSPLAEQIGWEILFNPDEEIGSPLSAAWIQQAARRADVGLIYEPSFPDGHLAGARKGSGNFSLLAKGRAAHAGREHHLGRNAIRLLSEALVYVDDLNGQRTGVTLNPGFVHGGGAVNIVPDTAMARFNIRIEQAEDAAWCQAQLEQMLRKLNARDGLHLELHGGFTRMPKVLSPANQRLFALAQDCGQSLGLRLDVKPTGGCCDGNNLAAAGVPNIDTLGVHGGHIHSSKEWMRISSLSERAQVSALLLLRLAAGEWSPA
jgi:glutamate carboxypeptidase